MANLGYVGLGVMGSRMVDRLMAKGHTVTGYNRTKAKAQWLLDKGMQWGTRLAPWPRPPMWCSSWSPIWRRFVRGPDGLVEGVRPGTIIVDMSTLSPETSRALAARIRAKGGDMVDSPVSGSVVTLEQGKLTMMVGGTAETFAKVHPLLLDIGPKATHVGDNGLAVSMKIATNLNLAVQMLAFSEAVLLAEKSGIARKTAVEVLVNSVAASPMVQYRGPMILNMPDEAWFDMKMMQKDTALALELGRRVRVPLPTTSVANEFLTAGRATGLEKKDFAAIFQVLAKLSGVNE
jgi:3-hydroxyisobutyrate dehydrogenase-like beta-hydroxyacid dehydrogenase